MSMAPNPTSPAEIWVVSYSRQPQVFRTQDGGLTWSYLSNLAFSFDMGGLAVAPANPAVLYLPESSFVYKSVDGGRTWNSFSYGNAGYNYNGKAVVSPAVPELVYIGGSCKDSSGKYRMGVLKSTDGGLTWSGKPVMAAWD